MLNEERIKHMTKLAFYETKGGSEELEISFHYKKDYISFNTFWSGLWFTIAYGVLIAIIGVAFLGKILDAMTSTQLMAVTGSVIGLYVILLLAYTKKAKKIYKRKHARAYHHAKRFKDELDELEKLYAKENDNE